MKHSLDLLVGSILIVTALLGCSTAAQPTADQPVVAVAAATSAPIATSVSAGLAPTATNVPPITVPPERDTFVLPSSCYREGLPTFVDKGSGYCFAYPQHYFAAGAMDQGQTSILGPALDTSPDPLRATLNVQVRPANGKGLPDLLSAYALETNTSPETPLGEITLDGEKAQVQDPVNGRPKARAALLVHNGKLFILSFAPSLKDTPAAQQTDVWKKGQKDMEALYEIVTSSFAFLDNPRQAGTNATIGLPGRCLVKGDALYMDSERGYCVAIPAGSVVDEMNPGERAIFGPALDKSADPLRASLAIQTRPAAGKSLPDLISGYLAETGTSAETRLENLTLDGQNAKVADPVNGRPNARAALTLHNDTLFILSFAPSLKGTSADQQAAPWLQGAKDMQALFDLASQSFGFLPESK